MADEIDRNKSVKKPEMPPQSSGTEQAFPSNPESDRKIKDLELELSKAKEKALSAEILLKEKENARFEMEEMFKNLREQLRREKFAQDVENERLNARARVEALENRLTEMNRLLVDALKDRDKTDRNMTQSVEEDWNRKTDRLEGELASSHGELQIRLESLHALEKMHLELEGKLNVLQSEKDRLLREIGELRETVQLFKSENERIGADSRERERQVRDLMHKREEASASLREDLEKGLMTLRHQLSQSLAQIEELAGFKSSYERLTGEYEVLTGRLKSLEQDHDARLRGKDEEKNALRLALENDIERLRRQILDNSEEAGRVVGYKKQFLQIFEEDQALKERLRSIEEKLEERISRKEEEINSLRAGDDIEELRRQLVQAASDIARLTGHKNAYESLIVEHRAVADRLRDAEEKLAEHLSGKDKEIAEIKSRIEQDMEDRHRSTIVKLEAQCLDLTRKVGGLLNNERTIAQVKRSKESLFEEIDRLKDYSRDQGDARRQSETTAARLDESVRSLEEERKAASERLILQDQMIATFERKLEEADARYHDMKDSHLKNQKDVGELTAFLESQSRRMSEELERLKDENVFLRDSLKTYESGENPWKKKIHDLENAMNNLMGQEEIRQAENASLKSNWQALAARHELVLQERNRFEEMLQENETSLLHYRCRDLSTEIERMREYSDKILSSSGETSLEAIDIYRKMISHKEQELDELKREIQRKDQP